MHKQLTDEERYTIATLLGQRKSLNYIAKYLGRHRSTISREVERNSSNDGKYSASKAVSRTKSRRRESRRKWHLSDTELQMIISLIRLDWSPEQVSLWLAFNDILYVSTSMIYRYVWYDRFYHGELYKHLRHSGKKRRKRYRSSDSRGVLPNKPHIDDRPKGAENRSQFGHWEIDTVFGGPDTHCLMTLVDRKARYTIIGKLKCKSVKELNKRTIGLIKQSSLPFKSITADNGTEFHGYKEIEEKTGVSFYFANPYHSWERGTNENTNGLIRQYLPKGKSMKDLTQKQCNQIARKLNQRPRKCLDIKTPEQAYGIC